MVFSSPPRIFHVAAGRGCARAVHATIHVAAENDTFENTSNNNSSNNNSKCCDLAPKLRLNQLVGTIQIVPIEDVSGGYLKSVVVR